MYFSNQYMHQAKRQLSVDMTCRDDTKKLRTSGEAMLINCIEDLSNELFYEIFDYLDGRDLFYAFSNLNQRFEQLIMSSIFPLKIHHCTSHKESFESDYQEIIMPNRQRIISLHLWNRSQLIISSMLYPIDSSFCRLESLILHGIQFNEIVSFLPCLATLPCLSSLNIYLNDILNDSSTIYHLIFRLPMLKCNQLSARKIVLQDLISSISHEQLTSIERLIIDHPCALAKLYDILSYTPKIYYLKCENLFPMYENLPRKIPLNVFNLKYCSISLCYIRFDEFEVFIKKISSQLRVLRFNPCSDISYLDADRWEQLINKHMPYLYTFQFTYHDALVGQCEIQPYHLFINRFTAPFWIERRWLFNVQIDLSHWPPIEVIFSIQPNRTSWDESDLVFSEEESMDFLRPTSQLTVHGCGFASSYQRFTDYIRYISSLTTITSLYIEFQYFSIDMLVQFLHLLPHLDSLTIFIVFLNEYMTLTKDQMQMLYATSNTNKIVKMNIEQVFHLNHVDILINLCPQLKYLNIQCKTYSQLESIIRLISTKKDCDLRVLCLSMLEPDDQTIEKIKSIISLEKLIVNCTIRRFQNKLFFQWVNT